jgi:ferredoxin
MMTLRFSIDWDACNGHGQCVFASPSVFALDQTGDLTVLIVEPDESLRDEILDAAEVCPMQAIRVEG